MCLAVTKPISPRDQMSMNVLIDYLALPFAGARMLRDLLRQEGHNVGRSKVSRLMRLMGNEALYRKSCQTNQRAVLDCRNQPNRG